MSDFELTAVQAVIDQATAAGVTIPDSVQAVVDHLSNDHVYPGGRLWAAAHPDETTWPVEAVICCDPATYYGPHRCTCWEPVYDTVQAPPVPVAGPDDLGVQPRMCGDCAYRPDSPERSEGFTERHLLALPAKAEPFWCHEGMVRPIAYRHPALGDIPGDTADWRPPIVNGVPYRADGRPGLLCFGWATRAAKASRNRTETAQ
ncbi:MAG TPA: hypothetical protein VLL08_33315 [Kineosporiaceae bacterium]|nr:hypothetical protein [Kineosporiaceae bacterium]